MPLTFIDIERRKNWGILFFFLVLMVLYLIVCLAFAAPLLPSVFFRRASTGSWNFLLTGLVLAFILSAVHILFAGYGSVATIILKLSAETPDPHDEIHKTLLNIVEEIQVVTGRRKKIECYVIPSLSLNALAACDFNGRAMIGITEGLLSRLNRQQVESVIAHEAHHILSGDCLETTVAANLFGALSTLVDKYSQSSRGSVIHPALWPAWMLLKFGNLLNMFISREREYRADAAAVRMTRNPIALAETLHLLSRSWRGAGYIGSGFEMMCIVNPQATALDEREGFKAELFSTHPPIQKRIEVLLRMAHASSLSLEEKARDGATAKNTATAGYYAMSPRQEWKGPFSLAELQVLPWLSPLTWITPGKGLPVDRAWKKPGINAIFSERLAKAEQGYSEFTCPSCHQHLAIETYEGTQIFCCRFCGGNLVDTGRIPRIIARTGREEPCSERIQALGRAAVKENELKNVQKHALNRQVALIPHLSCPKCGNPMSRVFFSAAYLIEVDRCSFCAVTWFDENELGMLQCLIEDAHGSRQAQTLPGDGKSSVSPKFASR